MANSIEEQFKLYINDTGLLCAMYGPETKKAILYNTIKGSAKAGNTATVSLNNFIVDYKPRIAYKFISCNVGVVDNKVTLPHYMVMFV